MPYKREYELKNTGNRVDFLIDEKIVLEVKAKDFILKKIIIKHNDIYNR